MSLAIHRLLRDAPLTDERIDAFLGSYASPIVEGASATFLYRGAADAVRLEHWIFGLPSSQPFTRVEGTDLWYLILELPARSRIEYRLEIDEGGASRVVLDPLNAVVARGPDGASSVCRGAGYAAPDWIEPDRDARSGSIEEFDVSSETYGGERRVRVYRPAGYKPRRRYPLVIVHDGSAFLEYASLATVLDNLIHRLELASTIVALIDPDDVAVEYADDPRHARFVADELLPVLEERFPIVPEPRQRALLGASFGAVAALSVAWRHPGRFHHLALISGAFAFTDIGRHGRGEEYDAVASFVERFRRDPGEPAQRIYVGCGVYDSHIYENRSLVPLLQGLDVEVRYAEARDGRSFEAWRNRLRESLSWIFPGPLWMVYE
jgi:enterochelin esterase family protein